MKKRLIILAAASLTAILLGVGANYLLSLRKVTFILGDTVSGVTIHNSSQEEVLRLIENGHTLLKNGKYHLTPEGDIIATDTIDFTVSGNDMTIEVDPPFSRDHLDKLLEKERPSIEAAVIAKYGPLVDDYTLSNHTLYNQGEWFGGLLKPNISDPREQKDAYRIVLHKRDNNWEVIRRPEYTLSASRYSEVPIDILREINSIVP